MSGFIYRWINNLNNKKYIGSHSGTDDDGYTGSGSIFLLAIKKHGVENFTREILEYVDTNERVVLLEREKYWLDYFNAAFDRNYYNVAKDVIGGDTKAGWSDERRDEFRQKISDVWKNRTEEEINEIIQKRCETLGTDTKGLVKNAWKAQKDITAEERASWWKKGNVTYTTERRIESGKLGKERMGAKRRREAALKAVANTSPETKKEAQRKSAETRSNWSDAKKAQVFKNMSEGRKGKRVGRENGRAKTISTPSGIFYTLKEAMEELDLTEYLLHKLLKDSNHKD